MSTISLPITEKERYKISLRLNFTMNCRYISILSFPTYCGGLCMNFKNVLITCLNVMWDYLELRSVVPKLWAAAPLGAVASSQGSRELLQVFIILYFFIILFQFADVDTLQCTLCPIKNTPKHFSKIFYKAKSIVIKVLRCFSNNLATKYFKFHLFT